MDFNHMPFFFSFWPLLLLGALAGAAIAAALIGLAWLLAGV